MPLGLHELEVIKHVLTIDEGMELTPYLDCCGKPWRKCSCPVDKRGHLTIGIGRNLDAGISEHEANDLLENSIKQSTMELEWAFPWFQRLNTPRRLVIVCMAYNMGIDRLKGFQKMFTCISSGDFQSAGNQMLNSKWAAQVGRRAVRLAETMKTGILQG